MFSSHIIVQAEDLVTDQVSWKVKMSAHVFPRLPERGVWIFNENILPKIEVSEV